MRASVAIAPTTERVTSRLLFPSERVPSSLTAAYQRVDPEWCWVALYRKEYVGCLLAANVHGVCFIARIAIVDDAPQSTAVALLRQFLKDCRLRKMNAYCTFLDLSRDKEATLARIAVKAGAKAHEARGVWVAGPTHYYR